jgi:hypothetical protein
MSFPVVHHLLWNGCWNPPCVLSGSLLTVPWKLQGLRLGIPEGAIPSGSVTHRGRDFVSASWSRDPETPPAIIAVENGLLTGSMLYVMGSGSRGR